MISTVTFQGQEYYLITEATKYLGLQVCYIQSRLHLKDTPKVFYKRLFREDILQLRLLYPDRINHRASRLTLLTESGFQWIVKVATEFKNEKPIFSSPRRI